MHLYIRNSILVASMLISTYFLQGLVTLVMLLVPDISYLINYTAFSATAMQFACILALFWFRYKHPEWPRPFKVSVLSGGGREGGGEGSEGGSEGRDEGESAVGS